MPKIEQGGDEYYIPGQFVILRKKAISYQRGVIGKHLYAPTYLLWL